MADPGRADLELGRILREEHGLAAVFHPHADSHVGTQPQIERFLADTDPASVNLCLDTGHVAYYEGDNVELIRRYPDRIGYLHLKQADPAVLEQVRAEGLGGEAVRRGAMCEPPKGEPDMEALLDAVDQHLDGELFAIVEQDLYPATPTTRCRSPSGPTSTCDSWALGVMRDDLGSASSAPARWAGTTWSGWPPASPTPRWWPSPTCTSRGPSRWPSRSGRAPTPTATS